MTPIQFGTPPFSSPDPKTIGLRPLSDMSTGGGDYEEENGEAKEGEEKKAADWKAEVDAAENQDALDAVVQAYEESGADYKSVVDAIEKKQDELNG